MSFYEMGMKRLRDDAVKEGKESGHHYLLGVVYSECCTNAVGRSSYNSYDNAASAIAAACNLSATVDFSDTEWYMDDDCESADDVTGDPAMTRAMDDLLKHGRINLGDYDLVLDKIA